MRPRAILAAPQVIADGSTSLHLKSARAIQMEKTLRIASRHKSDQTIRERVPQKDVVRKLKGDDMHDIAHEADHPSRHRSSFFAPLSSTCAGCVAREQRHKRFSNQ